MLNLNCNILNTVRRKFKFGENAIIQDYPNILFNTEKLDFFVKNLINQ